MSNILVLEDEQVETGSPQTPQDQDRSMNRKSVKFAMDRSVKFAGNEEEVE